MPIRVVMELSPDEAAFDEAEIGRVFDDDAEGILDLIALVTTDLPRYSARLTGHVERAEWHDAGRLAHTIKGAAGNVYAPLVQKLAHAVERAAKEDRVDSVPNDARALVDAVEVLVRALDQWAARLRLHREVA